ncbi:MAG: replication factor C large subunit [Nanoarchaeota archaeon]|nr:replication factor C large subunit [Nanoarchaeota archaeon]MBU1103281.1 replication factor C large subunit [Nanoarchaeota archaeon]
MSLSEKYRAKKYEDIVKQDKAIDEVKSFLKQFPKKKSLILYGPAGTGKTSLVLAAARENNLEILELNSSDLRNRAKLEETLRPAAQQRSLFKKGKILLMDEVDGVTGTDTGGIPELVRVINSTHYPIIMTCNDVWQSKLSPVRQKSKLVEMKPLDVGTIISLLMKITEKENLDKSPYFLKQIAIKSQGDTRAAINDLESYSETDEFTIDLTEKRDVQASIFNILRRLFKERQDFIRLFDNSELSLDQIFLWIEENIPKEYSGRELAKAYAALASADVFRGRIYKNQSWRFLIYQNIFQSAGISYAKDSPLGGFTKYERPKRILKIWLNNQKIAKKKTISKKYARFVHCSTKRIMRDFPILTPMLKQEDVQKKLRFSDEEIAYVNGLK